MVYLVRLSARAERDFERLYEDVRVAESETAVAWYRGLRDAILSLHEHPKRCPVTAEDRRLRHLLYGERPRVYRVIFRIDDRRNQVDVLHIRHGARRRVRGR